MCNRLCGRQTPEVWAGSGQRVVDEYPRKLPSISTPSLLTRTSTRTSSRTRSRTTTSTPTSEDEDVDEDDVDVDDEVKEKGLLKAYCLILAPGFGMSYDDEEIDGILKSSTQSVACTSAKPTIQGNMVKLQSN